MSVQKNEFIWFNGEFVPWDDANVHVTAHALHYGSSVFEGIRAYEVKGEPAIFRLGPHVDRMYNSCKIYRMDVGYSKAEFSQAIIDTVKANNLKSCYIRPLVFRGCGAIGVSPFACSVEVVIFAFEWGKYLGPEAIEQGVDVGISSWRRMAPSTLAASAKIGGQYINSQFIKMEALQHDYVEGIALDVNGYVSEGSGENIFVVRDGVIYTPPMAGSILGGITRSSVITLAHDLGYVVREEMIPREMLYIADEVFFTGTAAEITPLRSIDHITIGTGTRGPVTERIQAEFFGIVAGEIQDRHGWLTPVT